MRGYIIRSVPSVSLSPRSRRLSNPHDSRRGVVVVHDV